MYKHKISSGLFYACAFSWVWVVTFLIPMHIGLILYVLVLKCMTPKKEKWKEGWQGPLNTLTVTLVRKEGVTTMSCMCMCATMASCLCVYSSILWSSQHWSEHIPLIFRGLSPNAHPDSASCLQTAPGTYMQHPVTGLGVGDWTPLLGSDWNWLKLSTVYLPNFPWKLNGVWSSKVVYQMVSTSAVVV